MKVLAFLCAVALFSPASAFDGQLSASDYFADEGGPYQTIKLFDYQTGSAYSGTLRGGFNSCDKYDDCQLSFVEISPGGYSFIGAAWRTADGCHNIDFFGALDSHHGYCCGSLPCDFRA